MGEGANLVAPSTVFQELLKKIVEIIIKARRSRTTRRVLRSTLKDLNPLVQEIQQYNDGLDRPRKEIQTLIKEKEAGEILATKCSKIRWCWRNKCLTLVPYPRRRLSRSNDSVARSLDADKKAQMMAKDMKETLYKVREVLELLGKENFGQRCIETQTCGAPENPDFIVGLDEPLMKLKMEVLRDGVSILGLTGLGGSGKTTLATKLCWDDQVRGKFRENILFVTFSRTPKLKIIVERIFEHFGYRVPEFESDEDAVSQLGLLLRQIGENPILLVLDDVWPASEALVEKFKFQMSDYKILVTSRVAFPRFGPSCHLKPLSHEDAISLFRHFARVKESSSNIPDEDLVQQVVRGCRGSPLALKVIGTSLSNQPSELWKKMVEKLSHGHSILDSNTELLTCLQKSLDILEDKSVIRECFMDLGLFPEDQRIPVTALIDMWAELYRLNDDGREAMAIINKLASMNLADIIIARKNASNADNYYFNNHFIVQHDLLRELAIYQSSLEPIEQRKRLIIDITENKREWLTEEQQGSIARMLSIFLSWCVKQKPQQVLARILSISTDETFTSYLSNMQPAEAEVLILNLRAKQGSLPESMEKMTKLKVLIVANHGFHPSELNNFSLLGSLSDLKRMRLEQISVPSLGTLKNLQKLSLYMCNTNQAFENSAIPISDALPNLVDLNIDYCKDMVELPTGLCDIRPLKKLSISNCHKLATLPQEIGNLVNLEVLRLNSCTDLVELPDSIARLSNLSLLDISDCISLTNLPEDIGNLSNLRNLYMTSCARCQLPSSVINLEHLKVISDEETAASWEVYKPMLPNLMIEVPQVDVNLNWLRGISS